MGKEKKKMNNNNQTSLFNEIAEECRKNKAFPNSMEIGEYENVLFCRLQRTAIHYELQYYTLANMIGIEIHIENKKDKEKKDYKKKEKQIKLLQKYLKYFIDVKVLNKHIMYDPYWRNSCGLGRIYILCDYSIDKEKILSYINEFIYQTWERISLIVPDWEK
jgi:hypothetical protein